MKKITSSKRAPLTIEELKQLKADDFARLKLTDDEKNLLREINKAREQDRVARVARVARVQVEQMPLLTELQAVGLRIQSVTDLINCREKYEAGIPVLLKHLVMPYSDVTKETIARSLAVPDQEVRKAWPILVEEYRKAPHGLGIIAPGDTDKLHLGAKDGLACALSAAVTDLTIEELIFLAKDSAQGESRLLLLPALRKSKNPLAKQALVDLATDPDLIKEIASWKK